MGSVRKSDELDPNELNEPFELKALSELFEREKAGPGISSSMHINAARSVGRRWNALTGRKYFRAFGPWALPTATMVEAFGL